MIIAVEGESAAGKTTWASRYAPAVVEELTGAAPPAGSEQIGDDRSVSALLVVPELGTRARLETGENQSRQEGGSRLKEELI